MNLLLQSHRAAGGRNLQVFLDIFSGVGGLPLLQ
jgi:hypothetical protein